MSGCCYEGKGWKQISTRVTEGGSQFTWLNRFNITVQNTGDVSLFVGFVEIAPGMCRNFGIDNVPCAEEPSLTWAEDTGTKTATIVGYELVPFDPCCN